MNKARGFADRFREICSKGNDIVIRRFFDFINAGDGKFRATLDLFQGITGNRAHLSMHFAHRDFDVQPFLEPGLFRPEGAHLGQCVAIDHDQILIHRFRRLRVTEP